MANGIDIFGGDWAVSQTGSEPQMEDLSQRIEEAGAGDLSVSDIRARTFGQVRPLWGERLFIEKAFLAGPAVGCLLALLIPTHYESSVYLMPTDNQSTGVTATMEILYQAQRMFRSAPIGEDAPSSENGGRP